MDNDKKREEILAQAGTLMGNFLASGCSGKNYLNESWGNFETAYNMLSNHKNIDQSLKEVLSNIKKDVKEIKTAIGMLDSILQAFGQTIEDKENLTIYQYIQALEGKSNTNVRVGSTDAKGERWSLWNTISSIISYILKKLGFSKEENPILKNTPKEVDHDFNEQVTVGIIGEATKDDDSEEKTAEYANKLANILTTINTHQTKVLTDLEKIYDRWQSEGPPSIATGDGHIVRHINNTYNAYNGANLGAQFSNIFSQMFPLNDHEVKATKAFMDMSVSNFNQFFNTLNFSAERFQYGMLYGINQDSNLLKGRYIYNDNTMDEEFKKIKDKEDGLYSQDKGSSSLRRANRLKNYIRKIFSENPLLLLEVHPASWKNWVKFEKSIMAETEKHNKKNNTVATDTNNLKETVKQNPNSCVLWTFYNQIQDSTSLEEVARKVVQNEKYDKITEIFLKLYLRFEERGQEGMADIFCTLFPLESDDGKLVDKNINGGKSITGEEIIKFFDPHNKAAKAIREKWLTAFLVFYSNPNGIPASVWVRRLNRAVNFIEKLFSENSESLENVSEESMNEFKAFKERVAELTKEYDGKATPSAKSMSLRSYTKLADSGISRKIEVR